MEYIIKIIIQKGSELQDRANGNISNEARGSRHGNGVGGNMLNNSNV
jgi:hypothetical protein